MSARWTPEDLADYQARMRPEGKIKTGETLLAQSFPTFFAVPGTPMSKPRQTRSDKWKERPCVMAYRAWADLARQCAGVLPATVSHLDVVAYFPLKKKNLKGEPHTVRPDADNIIKAVADALFPKNDAMIHEMRVKKRYDDGSGPRVEITVY